MEAPRTAFDQETWLTLFVPGAVLTAAVYVAFAWDLDWPDRRAPGEVQTVLLVFLATALSFALGVLNGFVARRLYNLHWPWGWPKGWWDTPWLHPRPAAMARKKFGGEMLPYTALDPAKYGYRNTLRFHELLGERARDVAGDDEGEPSCESRPGRHYYDVVSDVIKAWVAAHVGSGISKEAWEYAARFRQLNDAFVNLSLALPVSLILVTVAGPLSVLLSLGWRIAAILAAVLILLACQRQAIVYWIQWQGELCRLFYVAYSKTEEAGR